MTDKEKIRAEIERLAQLHLEMLEGYRADGNISAAAIENVLYGHDLSILSFIDSLQEEPVDKCKGCNNVKGCITCVDGDQWAHYEEPVREELGKYINELSKQFPEVSFAKLSRIAVRVAKWQKEQMMAKAIDGIARPDDNEIWCNLTSSNLKDGDKVKVIVIKDE